MNDYVQSLINDLPQQFKEKERIEQLYQVIGAQMQEIAAFYMQLMTQRFISTAEGVQLDRIGEIVVLTREEARIASGSDRTLTDDEYRRLLVYKTTRNYGNATYQDIVDCINILRGSTLGFSYKEDFNMPATIILETDAKPSSESIQVMVDTPVPRAGGVGIAIRSNDGADIFEGVGLTSQVWEARSISMDTNVVEDYLWYVDENGHILVDEGFNLLIEG